MFRRLRDDLLAGKIFEGMIRRGCKQATKAIRGRSSRKLRKLRGTGKQFEQSYSSNGEAGVRGKFLLTARTLSMILAKTIGCLYSRSEGWWLDKSHVVGT